MSTAGSLVLYGKPGREGKGIQSLSFLASLTVGYHSPDQALLIPGNSDL